MTFRKAYVAKRRSKSAMERKDKPFGGDAVDTSHNNLRRQAVTPSVPSPLSNYMLDSLKRYLDNIINVATQTGVNGSPLAEFSASLAVSVDTVAAQAKKIKSL